MQSFRILEGAAATALLFAPSKVGMYLKEIGIEPVAFASEEEEETNELFNIHNLAK
ncbi:hypothetical protein LCGC14_0965950 [marine sediment metagenome]|uniref:Uncharacterized protein n=1 Tax=marine sediment metagenome TaxID=412755 RepID=A0A0F9ND74_9ZZZZ